MKRKNAFLCLILLVFGGCVQSKGSEESRGSEESKKLRRKICAITGASGSILLGVGAGACFYKRNNLIKDSLDLGLSEEERLRIEKIANRYKWFGLGLAGASGICGLVALNESLALAGFGAGAGLLGLLGLASGNSDSSSESDLEQDYSKPDGSSSGMGKKPKGKPGGSSSGMGKKPKGKVGCKEFNYEPISNVLSSAVEYSQVLTMFCQPGRARNAKKIIDGDELKNKVEKVIEKRKQFLTDKGLNLEDNIDKVYVQKGQKYLFVGDIHGSVHSFYRLLYRWLEAGYIDKDLVLADGVFLCLLGDFADRGCRGAEVWDIVLELILRNPGRVFVIKGNHERKDMASKYYFETELGAKYKEYKKSEEENELLDLFCELWKILPSAAFLLDEKGQGIQACHGATFLSGKVGISNKTFIQKTLKDFLKDEARFSMNIDEVLSEAICWGDFKKEREPKLGMRGVGEVIVGVDYVKELYKGTGVKNIFRGHQHNGSAVSYMGDYAWWAGLTSGTRIGVKSHPVYTFTSCPEGYCTVCDFDGFGVLKINGEYDTWTLTPYEYKLPEDRHEKLMTVDFSGKSVVFDWVEKK